MVCLVENESYADRGYRSTELSVRKTMAMTSFLFLSLYRVCTTNKSENRISSKQHESIYDTCIKVEKKKGRKTRVHPLLLFPLLMYTYGCKQHTYDAALDLKTDPSAPIAKQHDARQRKCRERIYIFSYESRT